MSSILKKALIKRLRKGKEVRDRFVESHLSKGIAFQIKATRERRGWNQRDLAEHASMKQSAISRLESPDYGNLNIKTLRCIASAFDVGLIVRFVPFSELGDWVSGTPRTNPGLSSNSLAIPSFEEEEGEACVGAINLERKLPSFEQKKALKR
jgi:transcriptional regulator with XRE-family HTH domain